MDSIRIENKIRIFRISKKISWLNILITLLGGLLGYLFYYYTQCCVEDMTIHINPYVSIFYGLIFGALISYKGRR